MATDSVNAQKDANSVSTGGRSETSNWLYYSDIMSGVAGAGLKAALNENQRGINPVAMNVVKYGVASVLTRMFTYSNNSVSNAVNSVTGMAGNYYTEYVNAALLGATYNAVRGKPVLSKSVLVYPAANYFGDMIAGKSNMEKQYY